MKYLVQIKCPVLTFNNVIKYTHRMPWRTVPRVYGSYGFSF